MAGAPGGSPNRGAGAAGISLALEFLHARHQVLLVESGNLDADADTQSLDEGLVVGLAYEPLEAARARYFGGTTNMWTGWCSRSTQSTCAHALGLVLPAGRSPARSCSRSMSGPNRW